MYVLSLELAASIPSSEKNALTLSLTPTPDLILLIARFSACNIAFDASPGLAPSAATRPAPTVFVAPPKAVRIFLNTEAVGSSFPTASPLALKAFPIKSLPATAAAPRPSSPFAEPKPNPESLIPRASEMNFGPSFTNINTEPIPNINAITPTNGPYSPNPSNARPFFVSD